MNKAANVSIFMVNVPAKLAVPFRTKSPSLGSVYSVL